VLLGTPNAESSELLAITLTKGDPTWAGPLAGVSLDLPVYHVTEAAVRDQVSPAVYDEQVGLVDAVLDVSAIAETLERARGSS
jgi:glycine/sarcosine/betaine reductase complex component A